MSTTVRLQLWNAAELDEHLSGPGEIFRGTYFGDLVLTPEILRCLHDTSVASIRSRWIPEVHQTVDAEREIGRALGTAEAWSDLSQLAKRIASGVDSLQDGATELPAGLKDAGHHLVCMAKTQHDLLVKAQEALRTGAYEGCQQGLPEGGTAVDGRHVLLRGLRARRHPMSLVATNLIADMEDFDDTFLELRESSVSAFWR